jgi:hypothetical protein
MTKPKFDDLQSLLDSASVSRRIQISIVLPIALVSLLLVMGCGASTSVILSEAEIPFTGESVMGDVDDDQYRYFRYPTVEAAQADRNKVSADGRMIDGKTFTWQGPVHFYYLSKRVVIYVGENEKTLATIKQVFGPQFAGD